MSKQLTAKQAADFFGVTKDTLRFYEKQGIIPPVPRDKNGYRVYRDYELNWIYLALNLKRAGLSLNSISEFAQLFKKPTAESLKRQKEILREQIAEIDQQIQSLNATKQVLAHKLAIFDDHFAKLERGETNKKEVVPVWQNFHK